MDAQRAQEIEGAVDSDLQRWPLSIVAKPFRRESLISPPSERDQGVLRAMPRRRLAHRIETTNVVLPMARRVRFKAGILLPCQRVLVWLWVAVRFFSGNVLDLALGRASIERRAVRFRESFEGAGASLIKIGQQLSLRADILPYAYCFELGKLRDRVPEMPTSQAIAIMERNLGRRLDEIFNTFDPTAIGSASLACVYQAVLKSGGRVAIKVRRPGIGRLIAADLRALDCC